MKNALIIRNAGGLRSRSGFTLVELLVTIAIIAILLLLFLPLLSGIRKKGHNLACKSNLHQWGIFWNQYRADHGGKFTDGWSYEGQGLAKIGWHRGEWIDALEKYWRRADASDILFCPLAKTKNPNGKAWGSTFHTYWHGDQSKRQNCSYGINCWVYNPPLRKQNGEIIENIQGRPVRFNWTGNEHRGIAKVPILLDSMWRGGGPDHDAMRDRPPDFPGQWISYNYEIMHFSIPRHGPKKAPRVNCVYMDGHVESVQLKALWYQKWNRVYKPGNPVWSWPEWMKEFPEPGDT